MRHTPSLQTTTADLRRFTENIRKLRPNFVCPCWDPSSNQSQLLRLSTPSRRHMSRIFSSHECRRQRKAAADCLQDFRLQTLVADIVRQLQQVGTPKLKPLFCRDEFCLSVCSRVASHWLEVALNLARGAHRTSGSSSETSASLCVRSCRSTMQGSMRLNSARLPQQRRATARCAEP